MESAATPCPRHPAAAATFTCARCGSFACEACRSPRAPTWCSACAERFATPDLPTGSVLGASFQFLARRPTALAAICAGQILFGLLSLPATQALQQQAQSNPMAVFSSTWVLLLVAGSVYSSLVYALFIRYVADAWEHPPASLGDTLRAGAQRFPAMMGVNLLFGLLLFVGFLLCVLPGVFLSVALCLALPIVVLAPAGPIDALKGAWKLGESQRVNLFLVLVVCGAVLIGAGVLGAVLNFMLGRQGTGGLVVATVVTQGLSAAGAALLMTVLTHCYLRLSGQWLPAAEAR